MQLNKATTLRWGMALLGFAILSSASLVSPSLTDEVAAAPEQAVIVLRDGVEITGEIIEETDDAVIVRSAFGKSTIQRTRIKEIKRGANPMRDEFNERFDRASKKKRVPDLTDLVDWALANGLVPESKRALRRIIELDPKNVNARVALGHALLDGKWVDAKRVQELQDEGYQLKGHDLIKGAGAKPAKKKKKKTGTTVVPELTEKEREERKKREQEAEEFRKRQEAEYAGVPWENRHKIKTRHYDIECNSTLKVTRTYQWIMEALYAKLSQNMRQKHKRKNRRLPILIYKDYDEVLDRTSSRRGVGGVDRPWNEQVHTFHGTFGLTSTTYNVLAHEGTHQFQGRVLGKMSNVPTWVIEGLAVYYGDGSKLDYRKKKIRAGLIPRDRLNHLQDKIEKGTNEPLSSLISVPHARFGGSLYADAWALVHFCFNDKRGQKLISEYWLRGTDRQLTRSDFVSLANKYFGSMDELEEDWLAYVDTLEPDPAGVVDGDKYISDDFCFELKRPSADWTFFEGREGTTLVGLELTDVEDVTIEFGYLNNWLNESERKLKQQILEARKKSGYVDIESEDGAMYGYKTLLLNYADSDGSEDEESDKKDEAKKEEEKPVDKKEADEKKVRKRYRQLILLGLDKSLSLKLSAPYDDFGEYVPSYDYVVNSFHLILRKRW
ncbi:MAG: DUF1570 domain-containing protein [Planctomycetota bacterium]